MVSPTSLVSVGGTIGGYMRRFWRASSALVLSMAFAAQAVPAAAGQPGQVTGTVVDTTVTLAPSSQDITVDEGATQARFVFNATVSPEFTKTYYPSLQFDNGQVKLVGGLETTGPGAYRATFRTVPGLPGGTISGKITFRLCRNVACTAVYSLSQDFTYTITVKLKDWTTFQRDAGHTGFVDARYAGVFKQRWTWQQANTAVISPVATKGSSIFFVQQMSGGSTNVVSLTQQGAPRWTYPIGSVYSVGAPAVIGDKVAVPWMTMSSGNNPITVLKEADGTVATPNMTFDAQWSTFSAMTPFADTLYMATGYYGGETIAFDPVTGNRRWSANGASGRVWDGQTPAVDQQNVYYYDGYTLNVLDRATGASARSIADPNYSWRGYGYIAAPVLDGAGNVVALSGSSSYPWWPRPITKFTAAGASTLGASDGYRTNPVVANGIVYAAGETRLDAINEANGAVAWSWTPPDNSGLSYQANVVATDTLLLVSSNANLYAISLTDSGHPVIWSAPTPGYVSITSEGMMLVSTKVGGNPALVAYTIR